MFGVVKASRVKDVGFFSKRPLMASTSGCAWMKGGFFGVVGIATKRAFLVSGCGSSDTFVPPVPVIKCVYHCFD